MGKDIFHVGELYLFLVGAVSDVFGFDVDMVKSKSVKQKKGVSRLPH